jgi:hypothetical protein
VPLIAADSPLEFSSLAPFALTVTAAQQRKDTAFMRRVFDLHADSKGELSAPALMDALKQVEAPVLSCEGSTAESIFCRADANLSGAVDFAECELALQPAQRLLTQVFQGSCAPLSFQTS